MDRAMLQPVVALVAWTLVIWALMLARRLPAMRRAGIDLRTLRGTRTGDADRVLPKAGEWPAHNYNHLMEQPTIFYAIVGVIVLTNTGFALNVALAWGYVGLRIAHSLVQVTSNRVDLRFVLFVLSTLCLVALTIHAGVAVFHG